MQSAWVPVSQSPLGLTGVPAAFHQHMHTLASVLEEYAGVQGGDTAVCLWPAGTRGGVQRRPVCWWFGIAAEHGTALLWGWPWPHFLCQAAGLCQQWDMSRSDVPVELGMFKLLCVGSDSRRKTCRCFLLALWEEAG